MKQFKNLEFTDHPSQPWFQKQARMSFENGYGVSVVTGQHAYTSKENPMKLQCFITNQLLMTLH